MVLRFGDGIPYGGGGFQFIWNGWWYEKASASSELDIWWTPYQFAPNGASLILHDFSPLNAWAQARLSPLIGIFESHNVLILVNYILGAWGAYILAWYFTGNRAASVIAGIIYGFSTFHVMHLSQLSTVSAGWLPLAIYYLVKFVRDGGWRDGVFSVLMLAACALTHWYHLVFAFLVIFLLMVFGQVGLKEHVGGRQSWARALIPWLISAIALSSLIFAAWTEAGMYDFSRRIQIGGMHYIDPLWLVLPPPAHPVFGGLSSFFAGTIPVNHTEGVASLGLVAIILGVGAWFRKETTTRAWCWIGLILFLFALGPTISLFSLKTGIPGPFRLWSMLPGLNLVRVPSRFMEPFTLALAISAAGFVAGLSNGWIRKKKRNLHLYILAAVIIFETTVIPIPISGPEYLHPELENIDEHYRSVTGSTNSPDIAVNFPILPEQSYYLLQQTVHEIPTFDT